MKDLEGSSLGSANVAEQGSSRKGPCGNDASGRRSQAAWYRIVVRGHLDGTWSLMFDGLAVRCLQDGETALEGCVRDQSQLYGHLVRLRDLGLTLVSVSRRDAQDDSWRH